MALPTFAQHSSAVGQPSLLTITLDEEVASSSLVSSLSSRYVFSWPFMFKNLLVEGYLDGCCRLLV